MFFVRSWLFRLSLLLCASTAVAQEIDYVQTTPVPNRVIGWVEKAVLLPGDLSMDAKIDSGALTSSLDAKDLTSFKKDGKDWVRFTVNAEDEKGTVQSKQFERPVERLVTVRGAGGSDDRVVVKLDLCIGGTVYNGEEFTLRDRGDMKYPLLIGRRTIGHIGLVDVTRQYVLTDSCHK